ncbi:GIY-YIG nuclease family protein [Limosilactobacillus sp.]|uniref:GIY-YIG nuclease family protein n=1 Tax=Limosilactobacillus sp. TaxID=2773925 RepID=UPI00345E379B
MANKNYYFYVLYCADDSLYGGFTDNVKRRFATHQSYKGAKYTKVKARHPLQLAYYQQFSNKHDALSAEYHFKHQSRSKKIDFLRQRGVDLNIFRQRLQKKK